MLRRQVAETWSEKTLEMNPDWGLERTKMPVTLQGEGLEAGRAADRIGLV